MNQKMRFVQLLLVILAALLAAPIDGLAPPTRLPKIHTYAVMRQKSYNRNTFLKSSAASAMEVPAMESPQSLNRVQSKIVKALMVSFIASMCIALPV